MNRRRRWDSPARVSTLAHQLGADARLGRAGLCSSDAVHAHRPVVVRETGGGHAGIRHLGWASCLAESGECRTCVLCCCVCQSVACGVALARCGACLGRSAGRDVASVDLPVGVRFRDLERVCWLGGVSWDAARRGQP